MGVSRLTGISTPRMDLPGELTYIAGGPFDAHENRVGRSGCDVVLTRRN
jgi:hypothetical protein